MSELVKENCGVGLVWNSNDAITAVREGLSHRGRDAEGYGTLSNGGINAVRGYRGLLDEQALITLLKYEKGNPIAVHTRYKTRGSAQQEDLLLAAHPHTIGGDDVFQGNHYITIGAKEAMVHNGTVSFDFSPFDIKTKTDCDTEYMLHIHSTKGPEFVLRTIPASYSVVTMKAGEKFALAYRDRFGRRPLWIGVDKDGNYIAMSEDRSIEIIGGKPIREVKPGELVTIHKDHIESKQVVPSQKMFCYFEANYLAKRLSSLWEILRAQNINLAQLRRELGLELLKEHPPIDGVDFVAHIPKSPLDAAQAYAEASGLPRVELFYKINDDRAFMQPDMKQRVTAINNTLFVNPELRPEQLGRNFVGIDDSIVRGTNVPAARKKAGERGFRMRQLNVYTPMLGGVEDGIDLGCEHGIDMPPGDNFVTRRVGRDPQRIADEVGVDYVGFLSVEGLLNVFERRGIGRENLCLECIRPHNFTSSSAP